MMEPSREFVVTRGGEPAPLRPLAPGIEAPRLRALEGAAQEVREQTRRLPTPRPVDSAAATASVFDAAHPFGATLGEYRVLGPLAACACGSLHAGCRPSDDTDVVIRILGPDLLADVPTAVWGRVLEELQAARRVTNPALVPVLDFRREGDAFAVITERVDGVDLDAYSKRQGPLGEERALNIVQALLAGLTAARSAGLIHGAVNPRRILFAPDGVPRLVGLGWAAWNAWMQSRRIADAEDAASPIDGGNGYAGDVLALGEVFCRLTLGVDGNGEALSERPSREVQGVRTWAPAALDEVCGPETVRVVAMMMAVDPADRTSAFIQTRLGLAVLRARMRELNRLHPPS